MLGLFKLGAWLVFTAAMSFVFLVLLDYGPGRFPEGLRKESTRVWKAAHREFNAVSGAHGAPARTQTR